MKGFDYLDQATGTMQHCLLKYPQDMPDNPTLDDLALYCAAHRLEEGKIIQEHGIHTKLFLKLIKEKREDRHKGLLKEWKALDDTSRP